MTDSTEQERKVMFDDAVRNLEKCAELVIKHLGGEERSSQLEELRKVMMEYCDLDNNWKLEKKVLGELERSLAEETNMNKIDEAYANLRRTQNDADPRKHDWYLKMEKKIKQWQGTNSDEADFDVIATESTQSYLDPFTRLQMKDPVRNTLCSHSYERESVMTMLQKKKEMRCPVVGCAYRGTFTKHNLESDVEMLRQLKNLEK